MAISAETLNRWRQKYSGMTVPEAKEKKRLEDEKATLCGLVAQVAFEIESLKIALGKTRVTTSVRREVVEWLKSRKHSQRRSCVLGGLNRSTCQYQRTRTDDPQLMRRIRELAAEQPQFGYRRIHALDRGDNRWKTIHRKVVYRRYRAAGLAVRRRRQPK